MAQSGTGIRSRRAALRIGAAVVALAAGGAAAWLLLGDDEDEPRTVARPQAAIVSVGELRELAASRQEPVFWAGPRRGTAYELTRAEGGAVFLRYLPEDVAAGDPRPAFLTVATYPLADGYARVRAAARRRGATTRRLRDGGLMVADAARPSSVYLGYPDGRYQVEVYDPSPQRARDLVRSGDIRPIR